LSPRADIYRQKAAEAKNRAARGEPERMRRIGVLTNLAADDAEGEARITAFLQGLQQLGWTDGANKPERGY
jgi:putative ABC transport system substrate-binding protein